MNHRSGYWHPPKRLRRHQKRVGLPEPWWSYEAFWSPCLGRFRSRRSRKVAAYFGQSTFRDGHHIGRSGSFGIGPWPRAEAWLRCRPRSKPSQLPPAAGQLSAGPASESKNARARTDHADFGQPVSAWRIAASEEGVPAMFDNVVSLDLINGSATNRTKPNMNPPMAVPYITEADT